MKSKYKREIEKLYLEMHDKMLAYAIAVLPSESLAAEAVQDAFFIACQKPESLLSSQNPQGWLISTLRNVIGNTLRQQDSIRETIEQYTVLAVQNKMYVHNDQLPLHLLFEDLCDDSDFILLKEYVIEQKSYQEIAADRGLTQAACRKRVQRAKENLQKKLEKNVTKSNTTTYSK